MSKVIVKVEDRKDEKGEYPVATVLQDYDVTNVAYHIVEFSDRSRACVKVSDCEPYVEKQPTELPS